MFCRYRILPINADCGIIETITDCISLHTFRSKTQDPLNTFFEGAYPDDQSLKRVRRNFMTSLAGYTIFSYIFQLKDRHNMNILLSREGRLVHIDFGFLLSNSPGALNFEMDFKITAEMMTMVNLEEFAVLCQRGFQALRKHARRIIGLVSLMNCTAPHLPCFAAGAKAISDLESRFKLSLSEEDSNRFIDTLVRGSIDSFFTRQYDNFQRLTNSIQ